jgi:ABC-type dipeptide/oligopeptide/nickel transport system ATPase subunit
MQENKPEFLVFDESIASLDCITKNGIIKYLLCDIFCKHNLTVLFISHDFRAIEVIYETLAASLKDDIKKVFKHYIIIKHNLYEVVNTAFPKYRENEKNHKKNQYKILGNDRDETVYLRLNENSINEGKTE